MSEGRTALGRYVLPLALGSLGGFLASEFVHDREGRDARETRVEVIRAEGSSAASPELLRRLEALERRAAEAPAAVRAEREPGDDGLDAEELAREPVDEDREDRHFAQLIAEAWVEPRDVRWAREVESKVAVDLTALGVQHGFTLGRSRCGSTQCVFELDWADGAERDDVTALMHATLGPDCPRTVHVPQATDGDGLRRHGVVLLSCGARAELTR